MREWLHRVLGVNRAVLALSVARLADGVGNSTLIIVIPLYVADLPSLALDLPDTVLIGILIALYGIVNSFIQPVMGALSDRTGRRKAFIQGGLLVMGLATLAFIVAERFAHLLAIRAFQAIGVAATVAASVAVLTIVTRRETRGGAMGVFTTFRMIGFAIGPLLGGWIHVNWGFEATFWTAAAFVFVGMGVVQAWVQDPKVEATREAAARFRIFDPDLLSVGIVGVGVATFVMAADIAMMATLENEFNARLDQTTLGFGVAFSALTISRLLFQVPLGSLSDRIGRKPVIMVGLALLAPTTAALAWAGSTEWLAGARLVQGIASAAIAAPAFALGADLSRVGGEGRQLSVLTMGFGLGIAVGPLLAGILAVWSFHAPFVIGAAMALAAVEVVRRWVPETIGPAGERPVPDPETVGGFD